jgi:NhaA family Na+:H+ antiporter
MRFPIALLLHVRLGHNFAMIKNFFKSDVSGGIVLLLAAILAMITANSSFATLYNGALHTGMLGSFTWHHFINDVLMAIFFFAVGLEIKHEIVDGSLSTLKKAAFPTVAAIGGVIMPAIIYVLFNKGDDVALNGWAIPSATDIAFALGVLALVGNRVPASLRLLLLAIAVIDDLVAILIIAIFYGHGFDAPYGLFALIILLAMFGLNYNRVTNLLPYLLLSVVLWFAVYKSGIHATIAGVLAALMIPNARNHDLMAKLTPYVAFGILPIFAFANAGVALDGMGADMLLNPITLGIALGLFAGKQLGIFASIWLMVKSGFVQKPEGTTWRHIYGLSCLCGIGFTMALFIGGLALPAGDMQAYVRMGVLMGSFLSAFLGYWVLVKFVKKDISG